MAFSPNTSRPHTFKAMRPLDPFFSSCVPEPRCQQALPEDRGADLFGSARKATTEASQSESMCCFASLACAPQHRFFECRRMCWFPGISIPKQAGKKLYGEPCPCCGEGGKDRMVVIIRALFWNGYSK